MLFFDFSSDLQEIAQSFSYMGPFLGLLLCGVGLPAPEETFLIAAGFLLHKGKVDFVTITTLCSLAILLGDSIPYLLGRRYGMQALEIPWVARVLHPERFVRLRQRFDLHGSWAVFGCRFLPMLRIPGYFIAGTMGMRFSRLLFLDGLGVVLTVPLSIYLGRLLAEQTDRLKETIHDLHLILAFLVFVLIIGIVIRARWARSVSNRSKEWPPEGPGT